MNSVVYVTKRGLPVGWGQQGAGGEGEGQVAAGRSVIGPSLPASVRLSGVPRGRQQGGQQGMLPEGVR